MDTVRMLELASFIENLNPKRFAMSYWAVEDNPEKGILDIDPKALDPHKCGTMGCIAGWAVFLFAPRPAMAVRDYDIDVMREATELLNLGRKEAQQLFLQSSWDVDEIVTRKMAAAKLRTMAESELA